MARHTNYSALRKCVLTSSVDALGVVGLVRVNYYYYYYCDPGSTRELVRGLAAWGHYASARRLALWVLSPGHPARKRGVHEHDEEVR